MGCNVPATVSLPLSYWCCHVQWNIIMNELDVMHSKVPLDAYVQYRADRTYYS